MANPCLDKSSPLCWVETFEPSGWASWLSVLNPYPDELIPGDVVNSGLVVGSFVAPGVLMALGVVCSLIVLMRLCCCEPERKDGSNRGKSTVPSLTFAFLAFLFTGIGIIIFMETAEKGYNSAMSVLGDAYNDTSSATNLAFAANGTGTELLRDLDLLLTECPAAAPSLEPQITPLKVQVQEYMALLASFYDLIEPIPPQLKSLQDGGAETVQYVILGILGLPIIFVTLNCLTMVFGVIGTACCVKAGSCFAKCEDFCLFRLGSIGLALTILLVSLVSAIELGVGIGLSDFCGDADANVMTVVNTTIGPGSDWYAQNVDVATDLNAAAVYYITGEGSNPITDQLSDANTSLNEVAGSMADLEAVARSPLVTLVCSGNKILPITQRINGTIAQAKLELGEVNELLQPEVVYPYYATIVHKQACSTVIDGLAWLALFQFLVGMICLPCLACRAASFVHRRTFERLTLESNALLASRGDPVVLA